MIFPSIIYQKIFQIFFEFDATSHSFSTLETNLLNLTILSDYDIAEEIQQIIYPR